MPVASPYCFTLRYAVVFPMPSSCGAATRMAPELEVVHLQLVHPAANLASPAIALQHPSMQLAVACRVESQSWILAAGILLREAFRLISGRKASCCGPGRNWE